MTVVPISPREIGGGIELEPDYVLEAAKGEFESVVIVGEREDGTISVRGSHGPGDTIMLLMWAQNFLVEKRTFRAP